LPTIDSFGNIETDSRVNATANQTLSVLIILAIAAEFSTAPRVAALFVAVAAFRQAARQLAGSFEVIVPNE
jgi:hypothetical protein